MEIECKAQMLALKYEEDQKQIKQLEEEQGQEEETLDYGLARQEEIVKHLNEKEYIELLRRRILMDRYMIQRVLTLPPAAFEHCNEARPYICVKCGAREKKALYKRPEPKQAQNKMRRTSPQVERLEPRLPLYDNMSEYEQALLKQIDDERQARQKGDSYGLPLISDEEADILLEMGMWNNIPELRPLTTQTCRLVRNYNFYTDFEAARERRARDEQDNIPLMLAKRAQEEREGRTTNERTRKDADGRRIRKT